MNSYEKFTQKARAEGLEKGLAKGRAEGIVEGLRQALLKLVESRFGELDGEQRARIDGADEPALRRILDRAVTADSVDAALGS